MNTKYQMAYAAIVVVLLLEWTLVTTVDGRSQIVQPSKILHQLFVERVKGQSVFRGKGWQLQKIRMFFTEKMRQRIDIFLNEGEYLFKHYEALKILSLDYKYIPLTQFDIVTTCSDPPERVDVVEMPRADDIRQFHVIYREPGITHPPDSYTRDVVVLMEREKGQWLISDVQYGAPRYLPPLEQVQSMSTALDVLTSELKAGTAWAEKHNVEKIEK